MTHCFKFGDIFMSFEYIMNLNIKIYKENGVLHSHI